MRRRNLVGRKFGRLTVLEDVGNLGTGSAFRCACDCGKECVVAGGHIVRKKGMTRSCGCSLVEFNIAKRVTDSGCRRVFNRYSCEAERRGIPWLLTLDQFKAITSSPCFYTGIFPAQLKKGRIPTENYLYNGIDRLDNSGPYSVENCVPCCGRVNKMKSNLPFDKFIAICRTITNRMETEEIRSIQ